MDVIDAHLHFWSVVAPGHEWPTAATPALYRDFGPGDLAAATGNIGLAGGVLVQSQPNDADTDWLLALAVDEPLVQAVVGWVDLASTCAPERIAELAGRPKLRGLRPMLQAIGDTEWLLGAALAPAIEAMIEYGLRLDALVEPRHLPMLARFVDRWPELPVVIDHGAKPDLARDMLDPWRDGMAALAARNVHCKLSGLRTEQAPGQPAGTIAPFVAHLIDNFGKRLMWGSDWPVLCRFGETYQNWHADAALLAAQHGADQRMLFSGAARSFYALPDVQLAASGTGR